MNTTDNTAGKLYLVSFGNSDQYLLRDNPKGEQSELTRLEGELNAFLRGRFPDETFAYFTTPRVVEIAPAHSSDYVGYPPLDSAAIESIKKVLVREVQDMEANCRMNDNAPFANINSAAAGFPHAI